MKKILTVLVFLLAMNSISQAADLSGVLPDENDNTVLTANIVFDWLDINQTDRDAVIEKYKTELFPNGTVYKFDKKQFKNEFKDFLKDKDYKRHYMLVKNNVKETNDENLCGFYRKSLLISYAVQYKNDLRTVYYYDVLGNLRYVDKMSKNYPNYPYMSKQYRISGKLVGAIYFMSHDMQYMYNPDQTFKGAWYKDKMYDRHARQVLTRTNW